MYWRLTTFAVAALLLSGCATPVKKAAPKPVPKDVAILVSGDIPDFSGVAKALAARLGRRGSIRYLKGGRAENLKALAEYRHDKSRQFVSIGLKASVAAKALEDSQVVFCQVFNYEDYGLLTSLHKGVSMVPSPANVFGTWKALAPDITDVGVITGPGLSHIINEIQTAARRAGITLHYATVNSDMEYQYAYKQMANKVQGFWLLPDNRVLSGTVLRDLMAYSVRNGKQVVVFSKELLGVGGLFSASNDYADIARQVMKRLDEAQDRKDIPGPDLIYPDKLVLNINSVMMQRFNLKAPVRYRKYERAF